MAVVITASDAGWDAHRRLASDTDEDRDGFAFLCDQDPVFTLRFEEESTVAVTVHPPTTTAGSPSPNTPGQHIAQSSITSN
ncbi:hypothetical protein NLX85_17830 [Micromonospora sp. A3M-1-15]|uniref:hypothetical protein n=1 Tax=Micromonospora sp. A3M-1-15 TaxID=2962035 RepID=UPI0020B84530|nr:hypothetical protein [Micromonospora sp. A3M-1-15]MCP3785228.1 hypothetical protein [Micromonospora sp. A3M-1-15]